MTVSGMVMLKRNMFVVDYAAIIVLLIENPRSCAGKRLPNKTLWFCSREFITLKGMRKGVFRMRNSEERKVTRRGLMFLNGKGI